MSEKSDDGGAGCGLMFVAGILTWIALTLTDVSGHTKRIAAALEAQSARKE